MSSERSASGQGKGATAPPIALPAGLVALRPVVRAAPARPAGAPAPTRPAAAPAAPPAPVIDLAAVQKEAFERGRAQERKESGEALRGAAGALQRAAAGFHAALEVARKDFEEFGLGLGLVVAEELVGTTIRRDEHDVRGIVRRILAEALPEAGGAEVLLEAHPDDLHLLPNDLALPVEGVKLRTVADPRLARGSFRARSEGLEVFAGIAERLEAIRVKLHQEAGHGAA